MCQTIAKNALQQETEVELYNSSFMASNPIEVYNVFHVVALTFMLCCGNMDFQGVIFKFVVLHFCDGGCLSLCVDLTQNG